MGQVLAARITAILALYPLVHINEEWIAVGTCAWDSVCMS